MTRGALVPVGLVLLAACNPAKVPVGTQPKLASRKDPIDLTKGKNFEVTEDAIRKALFDHPNEDEKPRSVVIRFDPNPQSYWGNSLAMQWNFEYTVEVPGAETSGRVRSGEMGSPGILKRVRARMTYGFLTYVVRKAPDGMFVVSLEASDGWRAADSIESCLLDDTLAQEVGRTDMVDSVVLAVFPNEAGANKLVEDFKVLTAFIEKDRTAKNWIGPRH